MNAIAAAEMTIRGSPGAGASVPEPQPLRPVPTAAVQPRPGPAEEKEPAPEDVQRAAEGVNAFLASSGSHIQFSVHQQTKRMVVEVIDDQTQEVVKTIPSKELLDLAAKIGEMVGVLLDKKG